MRPAYVNHLNSTEPKKGRAGFPGRPCERGLNPRLARGRARRLALGIDVPAAVVQAALLGRRVFPPPAPGADVLVLGDGARARGAADAGIALVVQRVVRYVEAADVIPHVGMRPIQQRIEFLQPVVAVELGRGQVLARRRLLAAQAGDPGALASERALERLDLAGAAGIPSLAGAGRGG